MLFHSFPKLKTNSRKHPGSLGTGCVSPKRNRAAGSRALLPRQPQFTSVLSTKLFVGGENPRGAPGVTREGGAPRRGVPRGRGVGFGGGEGYVGCRVCVGAGCWAC